VGDRRAIADARGIRRNTTGAGHVAARATGSALHDVLDKIETLKQTVLRGVEPPLTKGAGI
jgi:hypothetical protein